MTDKETIKEAVREAFQEELKAFYIDRETHYQHHQFLGGIIKWCEQCKSIVLKTIVTAVVGGVIALLVIGYSIKHGVKP
jgi:hypothetical protein